jgi:multidrug resistance protein
MTDSKTHSIMTDERTLEADRRSDSTPTESRGSDLEKSTDHNNEKTPERVTKPARRGSIDPDVEYGIPLVNPVEDKDEEGGADKTTTEQDPNVVDWDSKDDPERAVNWTNKKKWANMAIIGSVTFLTPLASSMVAPGVPLILQDFHSTNETIGSLVVSIYILGYAIGPLFIAPMSEVYGRLPVYHANNILFIIWTIACAVAPNIGSLLFFRVLAGIAGSCPITIGGGSIADLFIQQERGAAMALFALGPLMGPVIGPVAGGYLSQAEGWHWVFWVITIAAGLACMSSITFMRETYEPVLLQKRVNKLKKETGNQQLRSKLDSGLTVREYFTRALIRPTKMLVFSPIVLSLSIYMAVVYGYLYLLFTTLTLVFERDYHFSSGNVGLVFLGIGVGSLLGLLIFGLASDRIVKRMSAKGEMKPEYRLPPLIPGSLCIPIGLFWYGWSAEAHLHWIMPIIGTMFVGLGLLATFMPIQTYLVDAFTIHAASAIAANTVLRSLVGAFLPLAGPSMYAKLGLGWGNSLLAFIALALSPISWIFFKYGERIRKSPRFQVNF